MPNTVNEPESQPGNPEILSRAQAAFTELLPRIERIAGLQHRRLPPGLREDAVAETIGRAWHAYRKMSLEGRDPAPLLDGMVRFSARHVRAGKLLGRSESRDVTSRLSRGAGDYFVTALPLGDDDEVAAEVRDALRDRAPSPADEAAWRIDWRDFLAALSDKQRAVAEGLEAGLNPTEIARQRGVSKAAVQQVRDTLIRKWQEREAGATGGGRSP